jgi:hypothetical protein
MGRTLVVLAAAVLLAGCAAPPASSSTATAPTPSSSRTDRVGNVLPPLVDEATWAKLAAHPLRFPPPTAGAPCPVTPAVRITSFVGPLAGTGPVYVTGNRIYYSPAPDGSIFAKVAWIAQPDYKGPALIRGARIDAAEGVRFERGGGPRQGELRFEYDTGVRSAGSEEGWRFLPSLVLISGSGCYAFQIDGLDWSTTVVMDAAANP